jgi:hypothetical protein
VRHVRFIFEGPGDGNASHVAEWLGKARARGVSRLYVVGDARPRSHALADHMLAAFVGGGRWALGAGGARSDEVWFPAWRVGNRSEDAKQIWDVTYGGFPDHPFARPKPIAAANTALIVALDEAEHFAQSHDLDSWRLHFKDAQVATKLTPGDLLPKHAPTDAVKLAAIASASWVFGGMGWWNDLVFDIASDAATHEAISSRLYAAILEAVASAVDRVP